MVLLQLDSGIYYGLNEVGSFVWSAVQTPTRVSEILDSLLKEYDVKTEECESGLLSLLHELEDAKLIEVRNGKDT